MHETRNPTASSVSGDKLYQLRARAALPMLVRQAKARQKISYGDLASELLMPNARNLNDVLGAIGKAMLELGGRWGTKVPPLQALAVNKKTNLPGEGVSWYAPDAAQFKTASLQERRCISEAMLKEVSVFRRWDDVLYALGLEPLCPPCDVLPPVEEVVRRGGFAEGEVHRKLKQVIAAHPEWLGLPAALAPGELEVPLYSGDRVDVVFASKSRRIAVEVKAQDAPVSDLVRGMFQCVKYAAVLDAEARTRQVNLDCRAILALGGILPTDLSSLRATLGIDVRDGLATRAV